MGDNSGQNTGNAKIIKENNKFANCYSPNPVQCLPTSKFLSLFPKPSLYFHGREDKLAEIHRTVQVCTTQTHSHLKTIVIHGFGGMGKSEIVRAYANRFYKDYDYIVWFDAETKISVHLSFQRLAEVLGLSFETTVDITKIYQKITSTYNKGIFIFDNAEGLKTENNQFGIEEYLPMDCILKKPICIITSRNGISAWDAVKMKLSIISLDRLSLDETYLCVKKYLHINNKMLSSNLDNSICSIAKALDGYPLALSLASAMMGKLKDDSSFEDIETRLSAYMDILKFTAILEEYNESHYEVRLNMILEAASTKLESSTAVDLLAIMSYLDPHKITLKLTYAIFSCKCYDGKEHLEIYDRNFLHVMTLFQEYSLVKIDKDEMKLHQLIQKSARTVAANQAVTKILRFFEQNPNNERWREHMIFVYNVLTYGISVENEGYFLSMLMQKLNPEKFPAKLLRNAGYKNFSSGTTFLDQPIAQKSIANVAIPNGMNIVSILADEETTHIFPEQNGKEQVGRLKPRVCFLFGLFSVTLTIVVVTSVLFGINFRSHEFSMDEDLSVTNIPINELNSTLLDTESTKTQLKIMSAKDFGLLESFHTSVDISKIYEKYEDDFPSLRRSSKKIQHITISGSISSEWFYYVMREFPVVRSLTIDMDTFCSQGASIDTFNVKGIVIETVETYTVRNFKHCTSDLSKFFLSLNFSSIEHLVIEDSSLIIGRYQVLAGFLQRHATLFHRVTFQRCFICKYCKVLDIEFPNSEVEIFNRTKEPFE